MDSLFAHFQEYLILGLVGALFFKETLTSYIRGVLGLSDKEEKVPEWGARLVQYANHDTTDKLNKLIAMEEKEHEAADQMRETMKDIGTTLKEFKEYGVKIRKE